MLETITDARYEDDIGLLTNTPAHAKSLLHSLESAARDIGLYLNLKKSEIERYDDDIYALTMIW